MSQHGELATLEFHYSQGESANNGQRETVLIIREDGENYYCRYVRGNTVYGSLTVELPKHSWTRAKGEGI